MRTARIVAGFVAATFVGTVFLVVISALLYEVLRLQLDTWFENHRSALLSVVAFVLVFIASVVAAAFETGSWLRRIGTATAAIAGWCGLLVCAPFPTPPDYVFPWPGHSVVLIASVAFLIGSLIVMATDQRPPSRASAVLGQGGSTSLGRGTGSSS